MWSEKRGIEDSIFFAVFPIVINVATNVVYFISGGSYEMLKIVESFNSFTAFTILACCLFNFFTRVRKLSKEEKKELNKKMHGMRLLNIVFIGYIIFATFIVKDRNIIVSSLIMYAGYINLYMIKSKSRAATGLTETQRNWRKVYNQPSYDDINLLWKIKPMLVPHVSVRFTERIKNINWIILIFIIPVLGGFRLEAVPVIVIILIFVLSDILYLVDVILGLYTETEGICTGVSRKETNKGSRVYYEVYITDVTNKREIKFREYDYCNYNEYDVVKVIHGGLSKKVIEAKIVSKKF